MAQSYLQDFENKLMPKLQDLNKSTCIYRLYAGWSLEGSQETALGQLKQTFEPRRANYMKQEAYRAIYLKVFCFF